MPRRTLKQWGRRRWLLCETAWLRWRMRLRRKSDLQRDWESGDPARVARVEELAAKIRAEIEADEDGKGVNAVSYEFRPDWCMAPAAPLREWLDENGLSPRVAVAMVPCHRRDEAVTMIEQVLDRQPLTDEHARVLEQGTGIPARFWLALEHSYRAGLAAGLTDVTDTEE